MIMCQLWKKCRQRQSGRDSETLDKRTKTKDNVLMFQLLNLSLPVPSLLPVRTQTSEPETEPETRNSEPETQNPEPETRTPNPVTICQINCNYKLFFVLSHIVNTPQNKLIEHEYRFSKIRRPGTCNYTR